MVSQRLIQEFCMLLEQLIEHLQYTLNKQKIISLIAFTSI